MKNNGLFTSYKQTWATPDDLYRKLDEEFKFDFDPCPPNPDFNGILEEWGQSNYVNPPYKAKVQDAFCEKAVVEWKKGKTVVMLIPVRTSSKRWHKWIFPYATEIRFLDHRLKFSKSSNYAPFCSAVIVFGHIKK